MPEPVMAPRSADDTEFILSVDRDLLGDFTMEVFCSGQDPHTVICDFMRCYVAEVRSWPGGRRPVSVDEMKAHREAVEDAYLTLAGDGIIPSFEVKTLARRVAAGEQASIHTN